MRSTWHKCWLFGVFLPVLGGNGLYSSKCNSIPPLSGIEKRKSYFCVWLTLDYFERKRVTFFKVQLYICAFLQRKSWKMFCVWLTLDYFGRKQVILFHLQLYSPTFRRRKSCTLKSVNKSRSRLKRRRESVATWRILPRTKLFPSPQFLQARPHCYYGTSM